MLPQLVGMIHLPALPGSPAWDGTPFKAIVRSALEDARILEDAGFDAALVQNSLDRPTRERVDALVVAQLTAVVAAVAASSGLRLGVNVVKNDGPAAVAIAAATGAEFVRVKLLTGAATSAEGALSANAFETMAIRRRSAEEISVWADVREPTSRHEAGADLRAGLTDALDFGSADAVIVTGDDTEATLALAREAARTHPDAPLVIGGRISASSVSSALDLADAVIIGSALKAVPGILGRIDAQAAATIVRAAQRHGQDRRSLIEREVAS